MCAPYLLHYYTVQAAEKARSQKMTQIVQGLHNLLTKDKVSARFS